VIEIPTAAESGGGSLVVGDESTYSGRKIFCDAENLFLI